MKEALFILLVVACPLMMILMMRGHGHGRDSGDPETVAALRRRVGELEARLTHTPAGYSEEVMVDELAYSVPDLSCEHCCSAVTASLEPVAGVQNVEVNLDTKRVIVRGDALDDSALRAALEEAGYEAA
jgi:copper chaperone CopZ